MCCKLALLGICFYMQVSRGYWIFGSDWCDIWHSLDVLASTASILNLTVISLDRYWAITDPIAYPRRMSSPLSASLIALVWVASAGISFPAIAWWRYVSPDSIHHPHTCIFTDDTGYLIFSSIISFYFPLAIIMFAYYRIYLAATAQTRVFKTGTKVLKTGGLKFLKKRGSNRNSTTEENIIGNESAKVEVVALRVHRGHYKPLCHESRNDDISTGDVCSNIESDCESGSSTTYGLVATLRRNGSHRSLLQQPERKALKCGRDHRGIPPNKSNNSLIAEENSCDESNKSTIVFSRSGFKVNRVALRKESLYSSQKRCGEGHCGRSHEHLSVSGSGLGPHSPVPPRRRCSSAALSRKWASATLKRKVGKV